MNTKIGLLGVLGIWLTAAYGLPIINALTEYQAEQLMVARGVLTGFFAFIILRGVVGKPDKNALLLGLTFGLACLGLYKGVKT